MSLRQAFPKFYNKNVEISLINGKTFSGIFKYDGNLDIFAIIPVDNFTKIKYGEVYVEPTHILHIREIYNGEDDVNNENKDSIINDIKHMLEELFKRN